ncbi:hypothetical protein Roomu2_00119 [Pseudomonas phage vB_PpuM-Roomu-2]|uniref:DUF3592 domain-containing protein n=2 Tax=Tartuvirus TaxID=3424912 RepID=A0AAX4MZW6_9CAUD
MRTMIFGFLFILLCIGIDNTSNNAWTDKRSVNALITEKWEDWSGEATRPYKVLFAVTIEDNRSVTGPVTTTYYEKGYLDAREYMNVKPGETQRVYTTSYKDLGVPPTYAQKKRDTWNDIFLFLMFVGMPILALVLMLHYTETRY